MHILCINKVNPELKQKNPGPKDGTDRRSANNEYPIGTVQCFFCIFFFFLILLFFFFFFFFFSSVHTAEASTGPAMLCI